MIKASSDCCRLCNAPKNLISMFSGKSHHVRNCLRKMIQETTQIQIEKTDCISSVCFNCLVDVSNFYYFKLSCLQNQKLSNSGYPVPNPKKFKQPVIPLETIESPNFSSTKIVLDWLAFKHAALIQTKNLSQILADKECQTFHETQDVSIQCEKIKPQNITNIEKKATRATQTKQNKTVEKETKDYFSQTDTEYSSKKLCIDVSTEEKYVQTDLTKDQDSIQTYNLRKSSYKNTLPLGSLLKTVSDKFNLMDNCQIELPEKASISIQCDLLISPTPNTFLKDSKFDLKLGCKEEKLSAADSLIIPSSPQKDVTQLSNFSDLLAIKTDRSECVHICQICDKSLYNKKEIGIHNKTHMKCQFCKGKFKSIRAAQIHMKCCKFRQPAFVNLTRIDATRKK